MELRNRTLLYPTDFSPQAHLGKGLGVAPALKASYNQYVETTLPHALQALLDRLDQQPTPK